MPALDIADTDSTRAVLVTGGSGVVGDPLCTQFKAAGYDLTTLGRSRIGQVHSLIGDLSRPEAISLTDRFDILVHAAPLWLLPDNLESIVQSGIHRTIAFSSTSIETKKKSQNRLEQSIVLALSNAEKRLRQRTEELDVKLTLLRPTMIYGFGKDKNVMAIAHFIQRFGFFPIAGSGRGLRQPVHALDLAEASIQCLDEEATFGKTYNLGGGEQLSYKHMVERIFSGMGRTPRILQIPLSIYKTLVRMAIKLKVTNGVSVETAQRMNEDLCFDNSPAERTFGYHPSKFLQNPERDLPPLSVAK